MGHKGKRQRNGRHGTGGLPQRGPGLPGTASPVEEELDLHGLAIDEAMVQVGLALARWRNRKGACIRVIHGQSSGTIASIKGTLRRNLETQWKSQVRSFRQELANPGATLIFLGA